MPAHLQGPPEPTRRRLHLLYRSQAWIDEIGDTPSIGPFGSADGFSFGDFVLDITPSDGTTSVRRAPAADRRAPTPASVDRSPAPPPSHLFPPPQTWVNAVAWSPSGSTLAFATQASFLHVVTAGPTVQALRHKELPFLSLAFTDEATIVAGGFDMTPTLFTRGWTGTWGFDKVADAEEKPAAAAAGGGSAFSSARAMFASKVAKSGGGASGSAKALSTKHEAAIVHVQSMTAAAAAGPAAASAPAVGTFSTVGSDGRLVIWTM